MIDTHCHIHMADYGLDAEAELNAAKEKDVETVVVIGEGEADSHLAIEFATKHGVYATVGLHPHQAKIQKDEIPRLKKLVEKHENAPIVAIGECGLDYYYLNSPKEDQKVALIEQIKWAQELDLPLVYHVRGSKEAPHDAFDDFFKIIDELKAYDGVVHSFSATEREMPEVTERGLFIGLNGIITFTKDEAQITAVKKAPIDKIVLETDAPFLTPAGFRGKINSPQYVVETARHITNLRGDSFGAFLVETTKNAKRLFRI